LLLSTLLTLSNRSAAGTGGRGAAADPGGKMNILNEKKINFLAATKGKSIFNKSHFILSS
jgi:hypothetical protein